MKMAKMLLAGRELKAAGPKRRYQSPTRPHPWMLFLALRPYCINGSSPGILLDTNMPSKLYRENKNRDGPSKNLFGPLKHCTAPFGRDDLDVLLAGLVEWPDG